MILRTLLFSLALSFAMLAAASTFAATMPVYDADLAQTLIDEGVYFEPPCYPVPGGAPCTTLPYFSNIPIPIHISQVVPVDPPSPVPLPPAAWLFGTAILGLLTARKGR